MLDFHYSLLTDRGNKNIFDSVRNSFKKRKAVAVDFLKSKIKTEKNEELKAEALFILGMMRCYDIKEDVISLLQTTDKLDIKYVCTVVIGWLGKTNKDIDLLNGIMMDKSENVDIRANSASAMRQMWFVNNTLTTYILESYRNVLTDDNKYVLDSTIIACSQDILKKKWGIVESRIGEISGDVSTAKIKALNAIDKYLKKV